MLKVVIPMLMPYGVAALRVSYGVCWKIALISELFGAQSGLGYLMLQAQAVGDVTTVVATCIAIVILFMLGEACDHQSDRPHGAQGHCRGCRGLIRPRSAASRNSAQAR